MSCEQRLSAAVCLVLVLTAGGCDRATSGAPKKSEPPANVPNIPKEDKLNEFELTPAAEERLGIATTPIERRPTVRLRTYGGEVVLPTGASLIVTAPLGGYLKSPPQGGIPRVGEVVHKGQPLFELVSHSSNDKSVLTPAERVNLQIALTNLAQSRNDSEAQVEQTREQLNLAKDELERAEKLLGGAGTRQNLERAKSAFAIADKAYAAALERKKLWDNFKLDEETGTFKNLVIESPQEGIIRTVQVIAGEPVTAGAPLFEVMDASVVWVKVPVYVGELEEIATDQPARLSSLEDRVGAKAVAAPPVSAPPTALALSSTADLYYEIDNRESRFRPGQKMNAGLPLRGEREGSVIPWSAVVFDINGGTWVYESVAEHKYARRRVQVRYVVDSLAVLAGGPPPGAKIVTEGAAELFGTEFGFGK